MDWATFVIEMSKSWAWPLTVSAMVAMVYTKYIAKGG